MTTYTLSTSSAWAVQALAIRPIGTVAHRATITQFWGDVPGLPSAFWHTATQDMTAGGGTAVGDLLVAQISVVSGKTVTPPAGWTSIGTITGSGTNAIDVHTYWKIAVLGDLTGAHNWTVGASYDRAAGVLSSFQTGTFDAGIGVEGTASNVSSGDGTTGTGPATPVSGDFVIECVGINAASGAGPPTATSSDATLLAGQGEVQLQATIFVWLSVVSDVWHVGTIATAPYWH